MSAWAPAERRDQAKPSYLSGRAGMVAPDTGEVTLDIPTYLLSAGERVRKRERKRYTTSTPAGSVVLLLRPVRLSGIHGGTERGKN